MNLEQMKAYLKNKKVRFYDWPNLCAAVVYIYMNNFLLILQFTIDHSQFAIQARFRNSSC